MASFKSKKFFAPQFMAGDGRAAVNVDIAAITTALAANDTVEFMWPAGFELADLKFQFDDLDSTTAQAWQAGYTPVDSGSAVSPALTYFAAASAITTSRAGGRYDCAFKPLKFDEDMKIVLTANAAGTAVAGEIHAILVGSSRGVK